MLTPKYLLSALALAGLVGCATASAEAGEWRLDPRRCPDLREDFRDSQRITGWRDLREDVRDRRSVNCPASAWVWVNDRGRVVHTRPGRPDAVVVRFQPDRRPYHRRGGRDVTLVFHWN